MGGNPLNGVDRFGLAKTSVDTAIENAMAKGDIAELETLLDVAATTEQRALAQNALSRFSKTGQEIISKECNGSVKNAFPGQ